MTTLGKRISKISENVRIQNVGIVQRHLKVSKGIQMYNAVSFISPYAAENRNADSAVATTASPVLTIGIAIATADSGVAMAGSPVAAANRCCRVLRLTAIL